MSSLLSNHFLSKPLAKIKFARNIQLNYITNKIFTGEILMLEILLEFLQNRLGLFLLGAAFVGGGIYGWQTFRKDIRLYDAAAGKEGRTVNAKIYTKSRELNVPDHDPDAAGYVSYFRLNFETDGESRDVKVYVNSAESDAHKEGETIPIRYHPANPEYVLTPKAERPAAWIPTIAVIIAIGLGILIMVAVVISFL